MIGLQIHEARHHGMHEGTLLLGAIVIRHRRNRVRYLHRIGRVAKMLEENADLKLGEVRRDIGTAPKVACLLARPVDGHDLGGALRPGARFFVHSIL